MKKIIAILTITLSILGNSLAQQAPDTLWTTTIGGSAEDMGYCVRQTSDGGYVIAASTISYGAGDRDIYLIKTDSDGDTSWTNTFGGSGDDRGYSILQTDSGEYIFTGRTRSWGGAPPCEVYIMKTDSIGDSLWIKVYGGFGSDRGYCIDNTSDGGYIVTARTYSFGAGGADVYLLKTDVNGDTAWTKTYGGTGNDQGHSVEQTDDGGYIIAGWTTSFGAGGSDVYLIKTDSNGDTSWTRTYGGSGEDSSFCVLELQGGGYLVVGSTTSFGAGDSDVYLIKTDDQGDTVWTTAVGGGGDGGDGGKNAIVTDDGGYIIVGYTATSGANPTDVYLIKVKDQGLYSNTVWNKTIGGSYDDVGASVQQTSDGGYIVTGYTKSYGDTLGDVWLIRLDSDYNLSGSLSGNLYIGEYDIVGDISVDSGDSLTIEAGVNLNFGGGYSFDINGYLYAVGTSQDSINFINAPAGETDWGGIKFNSSADDNSELKYCYITGSDSSGIYCNGASPTISKCIIKGNSSSGSGGGIYLDDSSPTISYCNISENTASGSGGGIYIYNNSDPTISNCTISTNTVSVNGGGICCENSSPTILNNIVEGNLGNGGVYFSNSSSASITYSDFYNNQSDDFTGGVPSGLGTLTTINANSDSCDQFYNIFLDPLFYVTDADSSYYLTENSPCIDAGDPSSGEDPDGTVADMGAYYYHQTSPTLAHDFATGWHLFSIPAVPEYSSIDSIFGDDISGTYFIFNCMAAAGYCMVDSVEHGIGYWLALEDSSTVDIEGTLAEDSTVICLCQGWNMVGAAQTYDYPRDSLCFTDRNTILTFAQAVDSSWISASFYGFDNGTGSYIMEDTLEAWGGYWMTALEANLQMITYPLSGGDGGLIAMKDEFREIRNDFEDWAVTIAVRQGDIINDISSFGMNIDATDGYDPWFDLPVPPIPPSGNYVRAVFEHPEWNSPLGDMFCTDIRFLPEYEGRYSWTFRIEASDMGPVTVDFRDIARQLPSGYTAFAMFGDKVVNLLQKHTFSFDYTSPYEITVTVSGSDIAGGEVVCESALPMEYSIGRIYPNPFNPTTTIRIGLPQGSELEVFAYNILGQQVAKLADSWHPAGWHNVVFDASHLSSGIYFIKIEAPGKLKALRKVALIR